MPCKNGSAYSTINSSNDIITNRDYLLRSHFYLYIGVPFVPLCLFALLCLFPRPNYISRLCRALPTREIETEIGKLEISPRSSIVPNFIMIGLRISVLWGSKIACSHRKADSSLTELALTRTAACNFATCNDRSQTGKG
jgi:hypothetical protein